MMKRRALRRHKGVRDAITRFWKVLTCALVEDDVFLTWNGLCNQDYLNAG